MSEKRRGIVDPWRKVEPLRPKPVAAVRPGRKDLDDVDRDADLAIPGKYIIRSKHASFDITSVRVNTPKDALDVLIDCIIDLWTNKYVGVALLNADVGVRTKNIAYNTPDDETTTSKLQSENAVLWFNNESLERGLAKLARILRSTAAASTLKKHGITVMLNA